jgi:hypothetical protein
LKVLQDPNDVDMKVLRMARIILLPNIHGRKRLFVRANQPFTLAPPFFRGKSVSWRKK